MSTQGIPVYLVVERTIMMAEETTKNRSTPKLKWIKKFFSSKDLQLDEESKYPMTLTSFEKLDEFVKKDDRKSLESTLVKVERARRLAMLRQGDDTGFKKFCRLIGPAAVAFSFGYFSTTDGEIDGFDFGAFGPYVLIPLVFGVFLSIVGFMSLADTKREIAVKAREDDRERVLRAIGRVEQIHPTENDSSSSICPVDRATRIVTARRARRDS